MLCYIPYVVASYISFSLRKALKHFKKMLGHSSF